VLGLHDQPTEANEPKGVDMSYPRRTVSLQTANHVVEELNKLHITEDYVEEFSVERIALISNVFIRFGAMPSTPVRVSDFVSPGSITLAEYLRINMRWCSFGLSCLMSDWLFQPEKIGMDYQGCQ